MGVEGAWRRVLVFRAFADCTELSRVVSETFRFLAWEVVVACRGAAASQPRRQSARQRRNDGRGSRADDCMNGVDDGDECNTKDAICCGVVRCDENRPSSLESRSSEGGGIS